MSQEWLKPKKLSARFARSIILYPTLKMIALTSNYCTQGFGCPNWRSLATCLVRSQQTYFSAQVQHFYLSPLAVQIRH